MRIQEIRENQISFRKIQLSKVEQEKAVNLLTELPNITAPKSIENLKLKIFDIFDSHLQTEASKRSKFYIYKEDYLQTLYLRFFEFIDGIIEKNILPEEFIMLLNKISHKEDRVNLDYSLDKPISDFSVESYANIFTAENLPVYASQRNEEEREVFNNQINKIIRASELSEKEKNILENKKQGINFVEIAKIMQLSETTTRFAFLSAIAKIQKQNNILPVDYENYAFEIKDKYKLDTDVDKIIDILIKNPDLVSFIKNNDTEKISIFAKDLGIDEKVFMKTVLRQPALLHLKSETIKQNIFESAKILKIDKSVFMDLAIKDPNLFIYKPETLRQNIIKTTNLLDISEQDFLKAILKAPVIVLHKPETLKQNAEKSAKAFRINEKEFIDAAIRKPQLLYLNSETLMQNISESAKVFNNKEEEFVKRALKQPSLFIFKAETLEQNMIEFCKLFRISKEDFIKTALKKPELFYLRPSLLKQNIIESSRLFNISTKSFIKAALRKPQLFYQKPETLKQNIAESANVFEISERNFIKAALIQPSLFYQKANTLKQNLVDIAKAFDLSEKEMILFALKQPTLFQLKPENINKKIKINNFYHKIYDKYGKKNIQFAKESVDALYLKPLIYLVRKNFDGNLAVNKKNIIEIMKSNPNKIFSSDLPQDECTEEFIQYVKDFFEKNIGTQNYKFFVEGKEII